MPKNIQHFITALLLIAILTSCGAQSAPQGTLTPLAGGNPTGTAPSASPAPVSTNTPAPSPTPVGPTRPGYNLTANMDYDARLVDVKQDIAYPNQSDAKINDILLAVEPNLIPGVFSLKLLSQDGQPVSSFNLNGQRLTWKLATPLASGAVTRIHLEYQLQIPLVEQGNPNVVRPQIFGATGKQVNLTDWYPMVVPYDPGAGWQLADPWFYGEHLVYPLADFDLTLHFKDPANLPVVAASAPAQPVEGGFHYVLEGGRDFVFSMGRNMQVRTAQSDGVTVSSYYFIGNESGGQAVLDATIKALKTYSALFGSYHHKSLSAVQGDFNDGMEFDGLYYLSNSFYNLYDGTAQSYLVMIAAHETSHQWWWGRVANDQAHHPWMDEALASYCEKLFYEKNYPTAVNWWWSVRINFYQPTGKIDGDVPSYGGFMPYTNAVYKQGAHFFEDLRQAVGDESFFIFLKDYAAQMDGKIAAPEDFFRILGQHSGADLTVIFAKYFAHPPL